VTLSPKTPVSGKSTAAAKKSPARAKSGAAKTGAAKRQQRSGPRRDMILKVAAETFYTQGYENTSTQDIADGVGMLKGSLYYYISSKEDLLHEIINEMHEVWTANIEKNQFSEEEALTRIWVFVYNNVVGNASLLINSALFARDFRSLSAARRKRILSMRDKHDDALRTMIHDAQTEGHARDGVNVKVAALAIMTMCNGIYQWFHADGPLSAEDVAESYADLAVASVAGEPELVAKARARGLELVQTPAE
jgi:AcrR family transcriptional regulator